MQKIYDVIIIGAGAAGLFTSIKSPFSLSKLILEKGAKPGVKVLLSGGERANVSNMDIEPQRDYFGQNTKALISMFKKFNNFDTMSFFAENGINIVEEDRGRLILESGDSKELLELLLKKTRENNTDLKTNQEVISIKKIKTSPLTHLLQVEGSVEVFEIKTQNAMYYSKNVVITSGGTSFSQVGTTGDGYVWAKDFGHTIIKPQRGLCGLVSKRNFEEISGVSTDLQLELFDKNNPKKPIYTEFGPFLFTHFGVSGPIIFNTAVALGNYLNSIKLDDFISGLDLEKVPKNEIQDYITREYLKQNIYLKITFNPENIPKRLHKFFDLENELNLSQEIYLQDFRTWKEAKVTTGGVKLDELDNNLESKFIKGLYFAGEILDITGKTGGFNLQFAWTSAAIVGDSLGK